MSNLESCYSGANIELSVLIEKSLVFISKYETIQMHDLIQDMGKYIVKMRKDPGERNRLWDLEDIEEVMVYNTILLPSLRELDLRRSKSLIRTPDFTGMPNLEYLKLKECTSLKEVHHSLGCCRKLIHLDLYHCISLERFPCVNMESLESLDLRYCSSLENFLEFLGRMKPKLFIFVGHCEISRHFYGWPTVLDLSSWKNLVALPSSIGMLKILVMLNISGCSKFKCLPEEIGDLEKLEVLNASYTLISQPPSSIVRLNKLKSLSFAKQKVKPNGRSGVFFVFPYVNEGLRSLERLDLRFCNLIYGGLPEDIGCLSSLKELYLEGNNFEHLPRSMAQLSSLRLLNLSDCKRLTKLPEFQQQYNRCRLE